MLYTLFQQVTVNGTLKDWGVRKLVTAIQGKTKDATTMANIPLWQTEACSHSCPQDHYGG